MCKVQTDLTHVEVNTITGKEYMNDKKDMEYSCHDYNRRKFSQTSNTHLMHRKMFQEVGLDETYDS